MGPCCLQDEPSTIWACRKPHDAELVRALPDDGNRYEVIAGELFVTPAPRPIHQAAVTTLLWRLHPYVRAHELGEVFASPADIEFDVETLVQPDVFVAPLVAGRLLREWAEIKRLRLAIEIVSPSTARADRTVKRRLDLEARVIERWRPGDERPEILAETITWLCEAGVAPLVIDLPEFFAEVLDER